MARLLAVIFLTIIAFVVATVTWNRTPDVVCTAHGLQEAGRIFSELAEKQHPKYVAKELSKLAHRTRVPIDDEVTIDLLIKSWTKNDQNPSPRTCRRLRESLARLK